MSKDALEDLPVPLSIPVGFLIELSETNDRHDVLAAFARWVKLILDCTGISIMMPGHGEYLERVRIESGKIVTTGEQIALDGTTLGMLYRQHRSGLYPSLAALETPDARAVANKGMTSGVVAPITFGGRCMGLLAATYAQGKNTLDEDLLLLESMGRCLGSYMLLHDQLLELSDLAQTDALTKLYNRRFFDVVAADAFQRWQTSGERFALLFCDLDKFKRLNDTYGHDFGDQVLCRVAGALQRAAGPEDYVVRLGGEEFCVLSTNLGVAEALVKAERMRSDIEELVLSSDGEPVPVTISIGVAGISRSTESIKTLMISADEALYQAKANGRNKVVQADCASSMIAE